MQTLAGIRLVAPPLLQPTALPIIMEKKAPADARRSILPVYDAPQSPRKSRRHHLNRVLIALIAAFSLAYLVKTIPYCIDELRQSSNCATPACKRNPAFLIKAKHGAVASENEICSNIGVRTLKQGGNAVDAAVSTTLCIGVVNMFS